MAPGPSSNPRGLVACNVLVVASTYLVVAGVISLWCFIHPGKPGIEITPSPLSGYGATSAFAEVLVNAAAGALVGAFSMNLRLAVLSSAFAVLIDVDHLVWYLGFPVPGRPNHSFAFAVVAALILGALFKNGNAFNRRLAGIVMGSFFAHLAVDLFQRDALPLFMPFTPERISCIQRPG